MPFNFKVANKTIKITAVNSANIDKDDDVSVSRYAKNANKTQNEAANINMVLLLYPLFLSLKAK